MGEIADSIIEGDFCQECGEFMGDGDGYPRTCGGCKKDNYKALTSTPPSKTTEKLERVKWAEGRLASEECDVEPGPDQWSLKVYFHSGKTFYFWPFSGWFSELKGPSKGRGIANLLRASRGEPLKGKGTK